MVIIFFCLWPSLEPHKILPPPLTAKLYIYTLVLGSSSGIGAQTAVDFASFGANVVLHGRNEENLKKTAEKCKEAGATQEKVCKERPTFLNGESAQCSPL